MNSEKTQKQPNFLKLNILVNFSPTEVIFWCYVCYDVCQLLLNMTIGTEELYKKLVFAIFTKSIIEI